MDVRLGIGPANYAGQAYAWARAVDAHTDARADAFGVSTIRRGYAFSTDRRVPAASYYLPVLRGARASAFLRRYTHVVLDGFRTLSYDRSPGAFRRLAERVNASRAALGLLGHGDDVRDPDAHMARYAHSFYLEGDDAWRAHHRATSARNRETARALGVPLFVSTPDMLRDLPEATWVPVCLDPSAWQTDAPALTRARPKVLFVPSQSNPPTKGTRYVDPVLTRLHDRGVIEYVAPRGVPHSEMIRLVKDADIVVDQLLFGSYGVAVIEAMAAGRVVIGNVTDLSAELMPELPRVENATPDDFADVVASILDRREQARADAASNVDFVNRWHDGRESAARLAPFLGLPATLTR